MLETVTFLVQTSWLYLLLGFLIGCLTGWFSGAAADTRAEKG